MTNEEFDLMCQTYANVVLNHLLPRDEADARYEVRWYFNPMLLNIEFFGVKTRDPRYTFNKGYMPICTVPSYELDKWYNEYSQLQAKMRFAKWQLTEG